MNLMERLSEVARDVQKLKIEAGTEQDTELQRAVFLTDTLSGTDLVTGKSRTIAGSMFIFGHPVWGRFGSGTNARPGSTAFLGVTPDDNFTAYTSGTFTTI